MNEQEVHCAQETEDGSGPPQEWKAMNSQRHFGLNKSLLRGR